MGVMRQMVSLLMALIFFAVLAGVMVWAASISMALLYSVLAVALLTLAFLVTGGRAWFGTREEPERIIGARLRLTCVDGLPLTSPLPTVVVREFENGSYRADFTAVVEVEGRPERYVRLCARHEGYPISRVRRWREVAANAVLEPGRRFITMVRSA